MSATATATVRRIDGEVDLVAEAGARGMVWTREGHGFATRGEAMRITVPAGQRHRLAAAVAEALAVVTPPGARGLAGSTNSTGSAGSTGAAGTEGPLPIAVGALPFDPEAPATMIVPALTRWRMADGSRWEVRVGAREVAGPEPEPEPPSSFSVRAVQSPAWWRDLVADATAKMAAGEFRKVVLAREVEVRADSTIDPRPVLRRLRTIYPTCYVTHVDGFICASPELLVSRRGDVVRAHPMAGTAPRVGDPAADARLAASLLANPGYRHEHALTIEMVHDTLLRWCSYLDAQPEPDVVAVANVQHLATLVEGRLSRPEPSVLDLVAALHPTPAVGGDPREVALAYQREHERLDRRRYAGPVGWVDAAGNGEFAVGVRSAELEGDVAHVYAGNGIVAESEPATEFAETQAKFQAMLGALIRP